MRVEWARCIGPIDTRLGRPVAIKVLPPGLAHHRDRLTRMEREARALAALNHPNIAVLYGVEEIAGAWALVLELVDGETLASRLLRGLTVPEALVLARQIAAALDAAHEKGIVHRDLKPGNVMVTPAGAVKVLDFGLAKLAEPASVDLAQAPTETGATAAGAVLGTPAYMSPEQARGQAVDKRADIWAFGCVLFELLTRRRAFAGATLSDTLAAILEHEPDWAALPSTTPPRVREVLRRCLTKDVTRRARDIGDVALDLDAAPSGDAPDPSVRATRMSGTVWKAAAIGSALVAAAVLLLWQRGEPASTLVSARPTIGALSQLTSDQGLSTDPSLSADGRLLAYASNRAGGGNLDVYVQQTAGGNSIRLTADPADDHQPSVSPDGSLVAFRSERSPRGVYVSSALGGEARLLAPDGMRPMFSPDGRSIAFWTTGSWLTPRSTDTVRQTYLMPAGGGSPTRVATNLESAGDVVWAPDGRSLLVFGRQSTSRENAESDWWWQPVEGGAAVRTGAFSRFAAQGAKGPIDLALPYPLGWTKAGVIFTGDRGSDGVAQGLWVVPVDSASGRVAGDAVRLTNGTTRDLAASVAHDGRMVFAALASRQATFTLPLDANAGKATGPFRSVRDDRINTGRTSVSEDGRLMVLPLYNLDAGGLWVRDLGTGQERQLAATPRTPLNPVMSADGQWVAYTITRVVTGGEAGFGDVLIVPSAGGVPRKVCENCQAEAWTRDNQQVVVGIGPYHRTFERLNVTSGGRTPLAAVSSGQIDRPLFGPDGRWVTFNSNNRAVFVAPVHADRASPESEWTKLVALDGAGERTPGCRRMEVCFTCCSSVMGSGACTRCEWIRQRAGRVGSRSRLRTCTMPLANLERRATALRSPAACSSPTCSRPPGTCG